MSRPILLLALLGMIACKDHQQEKNTFISGQIENAEKPMALLMNSDRSFRDTLMLKEDGSFGDTLEIDPGHYMLYVGREATALYLDKGTNLNVNLDAADLLNSIRISGKGAAINNYLVAKSKTVKKNELPAVDHFKMDEEAFSGSLDKMKSALMNTLDAAKEIPGDYREMEVRNIEYYILGFYQKYEGYHRYYAKDQDFQVSPEFLKSLEELSLENEEDYVFSSHYRTLVGQYYNLEVAKLRKQDPNINYTDELLKLYLQNNNAYIRGELAFSAAKGSMNYASDLDGFYQTVMAQLGTEDQKTALTELYNKWKRVATGEQSPEFTDYENHAGGTTSLKDLRGKYVYIDVWATWCGPCKYEIPHLQKLEKDYHGKNIHFVSISIDNEKDHDKWKNMVNEESLGGIQLLADKEWKSQFVQDYMINGIPRFILLDPEGKVVHNNAARPSSEEIREIFKELNI